MGHPWGLHGNDVLEKSSSKKESPLGGSYLHCEWVASGAPMPPVTHTLNPSRHRKGMGYAVTPAEKLLWHEVTCFRL